MPKIILQTQINAPIKIAFNLARSIDLHKISTKKTNEEAIAGRTSGLIELNETVTWRATHLGVSQNLTSVISEMKIPNHFTDEMTDGAFQKIKHKHVFEENKEGTLMTDYFEFESPFGFLGVVTNQLFLTNYLSRLLKKRNTVIKDFAETEKWKEILENKN